MLQTLRNTFLELFFLPILPPLKTDGSYSLLSLQGQVQELFVRGESKKSLELGEGRQQHKAWEPLFSGVRENP